MPAPAAAAAAARRVTTELASAMAQCAPQAAAYGACMDANLETVQRGTCDAQFAALKECARAAVRRRPRARAPSCTARDMLTPTHPFSPPRPAAEAQESIDTSP